ncbi:sigma-54-dependent transcriptional regulator [Geoalkalibacter halelectricus]|uniref:Sigma-54 dependent transcriptional regulator n=1 Tax=Geoalkalibacter halelectricus TaxID=2847045 RepID=A0ABY5ZRV4_9BACT|nr:sigma-54 dependent transcriptional regulator [Geoalkalibacter halelectricus]MDO3379848.1 sigma-54 dependent transcriptional regulator [Geoalkalibacter halelectricus]UWZ80620.1 sigma-54 dependent transcriptional regulator [Geoalkalibacter halelectricus]
MDASLSILIVEDDLRMRQLLRDTLAAEGLLSEACEDSREALRILDAQKVDIVITDLMMPQVGGMEILERARGNNPDCAVILITGYGTIESAVEAIRKGAYDYVQKPFEPDALVLIVRRAQEHVRLLHENRALRRQVEEMHSEELIGTSRQMVDLKNFLAKIAPFDTTVLIQGETGTGKELVARLIHQWSARRDRTFLPINCGALPESLLESELFGHVRGAFTGADRDKKGLFETVDKGTLFLDEINSISPAFQVKLLRVLQEGAYLKVGGRDPQKVDVRIIAAGNVPLQKEVEAGRFRSDLFYRLNVVPVEIAPLRERREDIALLVHHFLAKYGAKYAKSVQTVGARALERLRGYSWPGNVRELENVIERAVIMAENSELKEVHLPQTAAPDEDKMSDQDGLVSLEEMEKRLILKTLEHTGGNRGRTADILGISPVSLWRKIKKYEA